MNRLFFLLLTAIGFTGCQNNSSFKLQAELEDIQSDTLWLIYDSPSFKIDTIYPQKGEFTYKIQTDTLNLCRLLSPQGKYIPIFARQGWNVKLKGSFNSPIIKGDGENKLYADFLQSIADKQEDKAACKLQAEKFIKEHTQSYVSAYIAYDFFIQDPEETEEKKQAIIAPLEGGIKDSYILRFPSKSFPKTKTINNNYINYFSCKNRTGKYISWSSDKEDYTLINFWASWDKKSITQRDSLAHHIQSLPKKSMRVLNISLDYDKKEWENACKEESSQWIETCDFKAWSNQVIQQNNIKRLPSNILVDKNRKIIATNLFGKKLYDKMVQLTSKNKK